MIRWALTAFVLLFSSGNVAALDDAGVAQLVSNLQSKNPGKRLTALLTLQLRGKETPEAAAALTHLLQDPLVRFRLATIHAVTPLLGPNGLPLFQKATEDADPNVRLVAAQALLEMGQSLPLAVRTLTQLLSQKDENLIRQVKKSFGANQSLIQNHLTMDLISKDPNARLLAAKAFAQFPTTHSFSTLTLAELTHEKDQAIRLQALEEIGRQPSRYYQTAPDVTVALTDPSVEIRIAATKALGSILRYAKPYTAAFYNQLKDTEEQVRLTVLQQPNRYHAPLTPEQHLQILALIKDPNPKIVQAAFTSLSTLKIIPVACLPALMKGLTSKNSTTLTLADRALHKYSRQKNNKLTKEVLDTIDLSLPYQRDTFLKLLKDAPLTDQHWAVLFPNVMSDRFSYSKTVKEFIVAQGAKSLPYLLMELLDKNSRHRSTAAKLIGLLGPQAKELGFALRTFMKSDNKTFQRDIIFAMRLTGTLSASDLEWFLKECAAPQVYSAVLTEMALALGSNPEYAPKILPVLSEWIQGTHSSLRYCGFQALTQLGPRAKPALPALLTLLEKKGNANQNEIFRILTNMGPAALAAAEPLAKRIFNQARTQSYASSEERVLTAIGPGAGPILGAWFKKEPKKFGVIYFRMLMKMTSYAAKVLPELIQQVDLIPEKNRHQAVTLIGKIDHPEALRFLIKQMSRKKPKIDYRAKSALENFKASSDETLKVLLEALGNPDQSLKSSLLLALSKSGPQAATAIPMLLRSLQDKNSSVARSALVALKKISPEPLPLLLSEILKATSNRTLHSSISRAIAEMGEPAAKAIIPWIKSADPTKEKAALAILGALAYRKEGFLLIPIKAALQSKNKDLRSRAISIFGQTKKKDPALLLIIADLIRKSTPGEIKKILRTLPQLGHQAFPLFMQTLRNPDPAIRKETARYLAALKILDPKDLDQLIELLKDQDPGIRESAALAVSSFAVSARNAKPTLEAMLKDPLPALRFSAAIALSHIDPGNPALPNILLDSINAPNSSQIHEAVNAIVRLGPYAKPLRGTLLGLLHPDTEAKQHASIHRALKALGASDPLGFLPYANDQNPLVRALIIEIFGSHFGGHAATVPLIAAGLHDTHVDVRRAASKYLYSIKKINSDLLTGLKRALTDQDAQTRRTAIDAMGALGMIAQEAFPAFLENLSTSAPQAFRKQAAYTIGRLGVHILPTLMKGLASPRTDLREGIASSFTTRMRNVQSAIPDLLKLLTSKNVHAKKGSLLALVQLKSKEALPELKSLLKNLDPEVQIPAAWGVAKITGNKEGVEAILTKGLTASSLALRIQALEGLQASNVDVASFSPSLVSWLREEDPRLQDIIFEALQHMGEKSFPVFVTALKHPHATVRSQALTVLARLAKTSGRKLRRAKNTEPLLQAVAAQFKDPDWEHRLSACTTLSMMMPQAQQMIKEVIPLLKDEHWRVRGAAIYFISKSGEYAKLAEKELIATLSNDAMESIRTSAAQTMKRLKLGAAAVAVFYNEIAIIQTFKTYQEAQKLFFATDWDADGVKEYAQRLSGPDSLFTPKIKSKKEKAAKPLIKEQFSLAEGTPDGKENYRGYRFKILLKQGVHAAGGAKSYLTKGNLTVAHALLAYPAIYGQTGRFTFLLHANGASLKADLGPKTAENVQRLIIFDPDTSWEPTKEEKPTHSPGEDMGF